MSHCCPCDLIHLDEALLPILVSNLVDEVEVEVLIFWTDGPQEDLLTLLGRHLLLEHLWIWSDCQPVRLLELLCEVSSRLNDNASIHSHCTILIHKEGIDVQLGDLRDVRHNLADVKQHLVDGVHVSSRSISVALQQLCHASLVHQTSCQRHIERRESHSRVTHHFHCCASLSEEDNRSEDGIRGDTHNQLMCPRFVGHVLDVESIQNCVWSHHTDLLKHLLGRFNDLLIIAQVEGDTTHITLVRDILGQDLQHDWIADLLCHFGCLLWCLCLPATNHRHTIRIQDLLGLDLSQGHRATLAPCQSLLNDSHGCVVGWRLEVTPDGRCLHQQVLRLLVLDHVHESSYRLTRSVVSWHGCIMKDLAAWHDGFAANPACQDVDLLRISLSRLDNFHNSLGCLKAVCGCSRGMHHKQASHLWGLHQDLHDTSVPSTWCITNDINRVAVRPMFWKDGIQLLDGLL
mmetsp:Transcript_61301/g.113816  ORF Transcript_61301/g.113816 Transcript_61301/m.113816 type:complete len:460 (+) Transcript_61301:575-1954(+)